MQTLSRWFATCPRIAFKLNFDCSPLAASAVFGTSFQSPFNLRSRCQSDTREENHQKKNCDAQSLRLARRQRKPFQDT